MAHSPQARRRTYAEIIRLKIRTADNPTGRPLSLKEFAKGLGCSYEHARRATLGEPVVSKALNAKLCKFLGLDADAMFEQMEREKIARRWKKVRPDLRPPVEPPLAQIWPQLSEEDRATVVRIARALAAASNAGPARASEPPADDDDQGADELQLHTGLRAIAS